MKKCIYIILVTILLIYAVTHFYACSDKGNSTSDRTSDTETIAQNPTCLPREAREAFGKLLYTVQNSAASLNLQKEVCAELSLASDVYLVVTEWGNKADLLYLPIVVYQEESVWKAVFLGENAVKFSEEGIEKIPKGMIQTFSIQGFFIRDGLLVFANEQYINSVYPYAQLTDNKGTEQHTIDLKKISDSDEAKWMIVVQDRNTPDKIYYGVDGRGKNATKRELIFLFVSELTSDYELVCGDLHVSGGELIQFQEANSSLIDN